jgi:hypothetical protein
MALIETPVAPKKHSPSRHANGAPKETQQALLQPGWNYYEKVAFRFFFLYFALHILPLDWKYYRDIVALDWSTLHFSNFFYLSRYTPRFFGDTHVFLDWVVVAAIAVVGTLAWRIVDRKNSEYNNLYYWLRVALRYRLAVALLAYGFIKFFPMQMPEPSISNLNPNYGDITHWKLFSMSTGIVPGYQSFLGLVELFGALLLLNRRTASIGAFVIIPFTGNVVMSNLAYEGGEYVYSLLLVSFAIAIFTSFEKNTAPPRFKPVFTDDLVKNRRIIVKSLFILIFVFLYGYETYVAYKTDVYQYPKERGLANASGLYSVSTFRINGKELPYSQTDPVRWKDVVFEEWATLSIRSNPPIQIVTATTEEIFQESENRTYELSGIAGRHYYSYEIDSLNHKLLLTNRNKNHKDDYLQLSYERPRTDQIILSGINANKDSIYVVLDKVQKKYLLEEAEKHGRRRGLKL